MKKQNLTDGPILGSLVRFSFPMIVINILQMLFHMADTAVLGIMTGDAEVAAVGACGSLISMLLCLVMGYASGANVMIAKCIGAKDEKGSRRATGAALVMGLLSGLLLMAIVLIFSRRFLIMTNCQPEILDQADLYLRIYFMGMPILMLYNFAAAILRAAGDSFRPMVYMIISGVMNVVLNLLFVGGLGMTVDGVAYATVLSNVIALVLILIALAKNTDYCKIERKNLRLPRAELVEMIKLGVPSCISGIAFYFGELVVVSAVNSISADAMTANAIAAQLDRINYTVGSSIAIAVGVMVAQNFGALQFDRIRRILRIGVLYCTGVTMAIGIAVVVAADPLIGILTDSDAVVELTKGRLILLALTNFITCSTEVFGNTVRALKRPNALWIVGLICGFGVRSLWAWFVWPLCPTFPFLFVCLPLSTLVGMLIHGGFYRSAIKREEAAALAVEATVQA